MDVVQPPEPSNRGYYIAIIICILIGLVYYFVSPYFSIILDFIDFVRNSLNLIISLSSSLSKNVVNETSIGSKTVVNKLSRKPKPVKTPVPDESSSTIQGGYCYVGEWKGIRSCVKVGKSSCKGPTYSTEELCVNPNLRP